jgi:hypothetical protein
MRIKRFIPITVFGSIVLGACLNAPASTTTPLTPPSPTPPTETTEKSLIEIGWDAPTPNVVRANIKTMEQGPFSGLMVNLNAGKTIFNKTAYPDSAYSKDRTDLSATTFSKLKHNFITIWSAREDGWDWFNDSDWAAAETNAHNFAKTAKAGSFKGFFFDPEPYGTNPWFYDARLYPNQPFSSVQAKVRQRGAAFLNAIQTELPTVKILTLFGVSHIKAQAEEAGSLEKADWVLLAAFIDGMLDVINPKAQLIDGHEGSYYLTKAQDFDAFREYKKAAREYVSLENRAKYDNQVKIAHAVYVDGLLNLAKSPRFFGYYLQSDLERQQMLEHNLYHALRTSDEYVRAYNENMDWWNTRGKGVQVPDGLERLLTRTAQKISANQALGFDVTNFVARASARFDGKVQVAGRVAQNGQGIDGVYLDSGQPVNGGDASCQYSNPDGYFTCILPPNWTGKIVPSKAGLSFNPPEIALNNITTNTEQNFEAIEK